MNQKGQEVKRIKEKDLENIRKYLGEINKIGFLSFINIGVNVGLRISDLAQLRFEMINSNWEVTIKEKKTRKIRTIAFNKTCQKAIKELKAYYKSIGFSTKEGYIFKSLSRYNIKYKIDSPVSVNGISQEFHKLRDMLNIEYPIGSHSLRKTWGYHVYKGTLNIALLMKAFNHSSAEQTLKYICIEEENITKIYPQFEI
ncbi:putative recombinase (plasmid) [Fusobacterium varium]|nr:putative recombinase [Fusobacterium varium]